MYNSGKTKKQKYAEWGLFLKNAVIILVTVITLSAVCLAQIAYDIKNGDSFPKGIVVNDVDLYGMSYDVAKSAVSQSTQKKLSNIKIPIHAGDKEFTICAVDFMTADIDETVEAAYEAGKVLNEYEHDEGRFYTTYYIVADRLKSILKGIAAETDVKPIEPVAEFDNTYRTFTYKDGVDGKSLDIDAALELIVDNVMKSDYSDVDLKYSIIKPEHSLDDIVSNTKLISEFTSLTTNNYNRNKNIDLMCSYVNGYVIKPDAILSINELVGERTIEKGFLPAPAIMDGKYTVDDIGGGICQLSGTLYNTALRANMKIVERSPHSWPSDYLEIGLDSTLDWNTQKDLKIQNNSEYNMYLAAWLENEDLSGLNVLHVAIYGQPFPDGVTVKVWSEITEVIQPESTVITYTNSLSPGSSREVTRSRTGYKTRTWREFYCNGVLLDTEIVGTSSYAAIRGEILVGKETTYTPTQPSTPTITPTPTEEPTVDPVESPNEPIIDPPEPTAPSVDN